MKHGWANIISYALNITFGLLLLYPFAYIGFTGRYLHEDNPIILYGEIAMSLAILVFGVVMIVRSIKK